MEQLPEKVKMWPMTGLTAVKDNRGGAWRLWVFAHNLDQQGSGKVKRSELYEYCDLIGINQRTRRRWLSHAIALGLLIEATDRQGDEVYYLAGLARGAGIVGCSKIGRPASVDAEQLARPGWRALVWAAYLVTLNGRPISQRRKEKITGIPDRTQRKYQAEVQGSAIRNYVEIEKKAGGGYVDYFKEVTGKHVYQDRSGRVWQRLPDIRTVPPSVAKSKPKGRSRIAQKRLNRNTSSIVGLGQDHPNARLFHGSYSAARAEQKRLSRMEKRDRPYEVFKLLVTCLPLPAGDTNVWEAMPF
jgi:hypothetical protein